MPMKKQEQQAPMVNAIDDGKLPSEAEVFRTMHVLLEGIAQIAENHGFERGDDLMVWLTKTLSPTPSQHTGWSDEAVEAFDRALEAAPSMDPYDGRRQLLIAGVKLRAALSAASPIAPATGFEVVAWVTPDILAAMQRGERAVPGWKRSDDFCIPIYARIRSSISPSVSRESGEP